MGSNFKLSTKFVNDFAQGLLLYDPDNSAGVARKDSRNSF
jgi:hypothetical protein